MLLLRQSRSSWQWPAFGSCCEPFGIYFDWRGADVEVIAGRRSHFQLMAGCLSFVHYNSLNFTLGSVSGDAFHRPHVSCWNRLARPISRPFLRTLEGGRRLGGGYNVLLLQQKAIKSLATLKKRLTQLTNQLQFFLGKKFFKVREAVKII